MTNPNNKNAEVHIRAHTCDKANWEKATAKSKHAKLTQWITETLNAAAKAELGEEYVEKVWI